jgi:hypothetical protein
MLNSMSCTNLTLDAGDVLYLPRGTVHVATTTNTTSMHMTYQLQTKGHTWADLKYGELRVDEDSPWLLNLGQASRATSSYGYKQREVGWYSHEHHMPAIHGCVDRGGNGLTEELWEGILEYMDILDRSQQ